MDEMKLKSQAEQIVEKVKELVSDGSASRVMLTRKGETILNLSLNAGIIGAVVGLAAAPYTVLTAAIVSFGADCDVEIEKKDGTIIKIADTALGSRLTDFRDAAKDKVKELFSDKAPEDGEIVADDSAVEEAPSDEEAPPED
ncbi:MAG: DUF4342 domain-containing protein [Clostridia bacterium]|nr:DUF4342 domain-containing protein [Clostridia bacterium]